MAVALLALVSTASAAIQWGTYDRPQSPGNAPMGYYGPCSGHANFTAPGEGYGIMVEPQVVAGDVADDINRWVQICTVKVHLCPPPTDANAEAYVVILHEAVDGSDNGLGYPDWTDPIWVSDNFPLFTGCDWYTKAVNRNDNIPGTHFAGSVNSWPLVGGYNNDGVWVNRGAYSSFNDYGGLRIWIFGVIDLGWSSAFQCYDNAPNMPPSTQWFHPGGNGSADFSGLLGFRGISGDVMIYGVFQPHDASTSGIRHPVPTPFIVGFPPKAFYEVLTPYAEQNVPYRMSYSWGDPDESFVVNAAAVPPYWWTFGAHRPDYPIYVFPNHVVPDGNGYVMTFTSLYMDPANQGLTAPGVGVPSYPIDNFTWRGDHEPTNNTVFLVFDWANKKFSAPAKKNTTLDY